MGKISDIWVRLGLKKEGFDKGMKDAEKDVGGLGESFGKIKARAVAVWAAIGAGVIKFSKDFIGATNRMNDRWEKMISGLKASYQSFLADLSNSTMKFDSSGNEGWFKNVLKNEAGWWKRVFGNAKEAGQAAAEQTEAFDAEFELVNSIKVQRAQVQNELNELYATIRDTTLSPQDRQAAADKYKALLAPLADAEIEVYTNMLNKAVEAWQAGAGDMLSRQYSTAEVSEFFANYGTDPEGMRSKYGELVNVYENRKGDKQNQVIFDMITKLAEASSELSQIDKELARTAVSIKKSLAEMYNIDGKSTAEHLRGQVSEITKQTASDLRAIEQEIIADISSMSVDDMASEFGIDAGMVDIDNEMTAFLDKWQQDVEKVSQLNQMLSDSFVTAFGNGMQALTDLMFGIEDADMKSVMAAFIAPFADTMKQMGSMIMSEGVAMDAFKNSFSNPYAAIAAGAALIAVGSAVSSGLQRLTANPTGGSAGTSAGSSSYGSSDLKNYESTLTVEVVGRISGNDIVLSGSKTNANNAR